MKKLWEFTQISAATASVIYLLMNLAFGTISFLTWNPDFYLGFLSEMFLVRLSIVIGIFIAFIWLLTPEPGENKDV